MARRLDRGARLVLASHNPGKLAELVDLLRPHGITAISAASLGLPEPEEDAPDFVGNARIKALAAARMSGLPALADDSGFCVAALNGAPGVHSARWAGPAKDFSHAMQRVNREVADAQDRRAWFVAALCLAWPDCHTETFVGRVDGQAIWPPRGSKGFGYDPMFVPTGAAAAFGEMDSAEKHTLSHRTRAFAQLMRACLLADAEPGEQRVEDVLHADAAGDATDRP
jgi:XTP/dITP diphosphohydrolase